MRTRRPLLALVGAGVAISFGGASCRQAPKTSSALGTIAIGVREGKRDAVQPIEAIAVGSRQDLAATIEVRQPTGWVVATWRHWPEGGGLPVVLGTQLFNTAPPGEKPSLFTHLAGDTSFAGWQPGDVTCDFVTGGGEALAGRLRIVRRSVK